MRIGDYLQRRPGFRYFLSLGFPLGTGLLAASVLFGLIVALFVADTRWQILAHGVISLTSMWCLMFSGWYLFSAYKSQDKKAISWGWEAIGWAGALFAAAFCLGFRLFPVTDFIFRISLVLYIFVYGSSNLIGKKYWSAIDSLKPSS